MTRVAVVTGGASGMGQATCHEFGRRGHKVAVVDLNGEAAQRVAEELGADGVTALGIGADVSDRTAVEEALYLSNIASRVTVVHRRNQFRAEQIMIDKLVERSRTGNVDILYDHVLDEVLGDDRGVTGVRVKHTAGKDFRAGISVDQIAAEKLGRIAYAMDIDPQYVQALTRWETFTGKSAARIPTPTSRRRRS